MTLGAPGSKGLPAESILTEAEARRRFDTGAWSRSSLTRFLDVAAADHPDQVAAVSVDPHGAITAEITYAQLDDMSRRIAAGLQTMGIGPRDVVSVMMTNSAEFLAVVYGVLRAGATYSGIPITYGSHEVAAMTRRSGAKALIVSHVHAGRNVLASSIPADLPTDNSIEIVVCGPAVCGTTSLETLMHSAAAFIPVPADPLSIAQLAFTSGTTSEPKAVMNLHAGLDVVVRGWATHVGHRSFGRPMRNLVMSPVGHSTGFMWGALLTVHLGGTAVFLEKWTPAIGAEVIGRTGITCMVGSPTFLIDLLRTAEMTETKAGSLELIVVAGAPIPRPLMREARTKLNCDVIPAWGMTEFGIAVSGRPDLDAANLDTDGVPVASAQVSIRDADGAGVGDGIEGALWIRGTGLFVGYLGDPAVTRAEFDDAGWFNTGDTAVRGRDGTVTITGRTKDIIIRGGENIPVGSVENLVFEHPAVAEVAIVGYPDPRLGERACAFIRCRPGATVDLHGLRDFLTTSGLATRYLPERVVLLDDLPKTMSGKIRKVELRSRLAAGPGTSAQNTIAALPAC